ncbi:MAG: hypothetical protein J7L39_02385 [Candidatus Aenigmarchaeota archaeon]|nr:hypothetical protein [Candidatus Aenigmarchaeota archaeon]
MKKVFKKIGKFFKQTFRRVRKVVRKVIAPATFFLPILPKIPIIGKPLSIFAKKVGAKLIKVIPAPIKTLWTKVGKVVHSPVTSAVLRTIQIWNPKAAYQAHKVIKTLQTLTPRPKPTSYPITVTTPLAPTTIYRFEKDWGFTPPVEQIKIPNEYFPVYEPVDWKLSTWYQLTGQTYYDVIANCNLTIRNAWVAFVHFFTKQLPSYFQAIWRAILSIPRVLAQAFKSLIQTIWNALRDLGRWIMQGLSNFWEGIKTGILYLTNIIKRSFVLIAKGAVTIGSYIWQGMKFLKDGIFAATGWLLKQLKFIFVDIIGVGLRKLWEMIVYSFKWWGERFTLMGKAIWDFLIHKVPHFLMLIWETIKQGLHHCWIWLKAKFEDIGRNIYDRIQKFLHSMRPLTPEKAPQVGLMLFLMAMGAGMGAHILSSAVEAAYPTKYIGLQYIPALLADLGSFSRIAGATSGVLASIALGKPMKYAIQKYFRPIIPDEKLLMTMAVKPDIPLSQFAEMMKYHGYSDYWINRIIATMYREPRYFELAMMAEDEAATEEWLYKKARRAGYNEEDSIIFLKSLVKKVTRTQRLTYYRQAFNCYKEGFIDEAIFDEVLNELEFRPEARRFSKKAAFFAYLYDFIKDQIKYYTDSYIKDLITEEELSIHLTSLGITPQRVDFLVKMAKVRKYKKPARKEKKEIERIINKARGIYAKAYINLYRKGKINENQLKVYLLQLGIFEEIADATVFLEASKKGRVV